MSALLSAGAAVIAAAAPFSITVTPAHLAAHPGQTVHVRVIDTGTAPVSLRTSVLPVSREGHGCGVRLTAAPGITVTPSLVTLQPRQSADATVTIARSAGPSDVAVMFASVPDPGNTGNATISGAVASQLVVSPGHSTVHECRTSAMPKASAAGIGGGTLAGGAGGAAAIAGGGWLWFRRRTRPRGYHHHRRAARA